MCWARSNIVTIAQKRGIVNGGDEMRAFEIINSIRSTEGNGSRYERMRKALICDISNNLHQVGLRRLAQIHDYVELKTEEEERDIRRELMGED